ncbi:hypothetical protein [Bradyrhizobium sp. 23]|uniref:hypothetical protein n=1 Tax=Bradyrhizobium sp. 23 TaxID=2782667 RepID=UPI001FF84EEC|nr:hypothetical protein [Bradyrhizobium sp. 23]MCK1317139.1 hypothetical protein [Bradyrhizobium sp. 23]
MVDALLGLDGRFQRAVDGMSADALAAMSARPISDIVADLENGVPLPPGEAALVARLHAKLPVASDRERRARGEELMREMVRRFGPRTASTSAKVTWLTAEFSLFTGGADWGGSARYDLFCPFADPRRAALWQIAKVLSGELPRRRTLHDILAG